MSDNSLQIHIIGDKDGKISNAGTYLLSPTEIKVEPADSALRVDANGAIVFDGKSWLDLGNKVDIDFSNGLTIEAWVKVQNEKIETNNIKIVEFSNGSSNEEIILDLQQGQPGVFLRGYGSAYSRSLVVRDKWTHVAVTVEKRENGIVATEFLNSKPQEATDGLLIGPIIGLPPVKSRNLNYVGKTVWNEPIFQGSLCGLRVYNRALSAPEVANDMYNDGKRLFTSHDVTGPLDFRLSNQQGQTTLYTRLLKQDMVLELRNTSRAQLTIETSSTFQLRFASGTLWEPENVKLLEADRAVWELSAPQISPSPDQRAGRAGDVVFVLKYKGPQPLVLPIFVPTQLTLTNISVDGRGGSRGTRVELKYGGMTSAGNENTLGGTSMHYLAVMDETPADEPGNAPIVIEWVGQNTFLNDGTWTTRTLRLYNNSGRELTLQNSAKITIDVPVKSDSTGWALVANSAGVTVEEVVTGEAVIRWKPGTPTSTLTKTTIELSPNDGTKTIPHNGSIDIPIKVKTTLPSGMSWITVAYDGFEHLASKRSVPVLKTNLVIAPEFLGAIPTTNCVVVDDKGFVGIGQQTGAAAFAVKGEITGDSLTIGGKSAARDGSVVIQGKNEHTLHFECGDWKDEFYRAGSKTRSGIFNNTYPGRPNFQALMISGNSSREKENNDRWVQIWDHLEIEGNLFVQPKMGLTKSSGKITSNSLEVKNMIKGGSLNIGNGALVVCDDKQITEPPNGISIKEGSLKITLPAVETLKATVPALAISGKHFLEFGFGEKKGASATDTTNAVNFNGRIGYKIWSDGLDLFGAGGEADLKDRRITLHCQGGLDVIGKQTCSEELEVNGKLHCHKQLEVNGDLSLSGKLLVGPNAQNQWHEIKPWWYINTTYAIYELVSDQRFKRDVRCVPSALDKIRCMRGVTFRWNENGLQHFTRDIETTLSAGPNATPRENQEVWQAERDKRHQQLATSHVGVIAQDVEAVLPEAVTTDADGYKSVRYDNLIPLLIEAIKEQDLAVTAQHAEIERLKVALQKADPQSSR